MTRPDDRALRDLAFTAIPSAWIGLTDAAREEVIDLLSTYDNRLALRYLIDSPSLDPKIANGVCCTIR
ncbi:MAG: hypothetical protein WBB07_20745 [Mycobacterium sp.]